MLRPAAFPRISHPTVLQALLVAFLAIPMSFAAQAENTCSAAISGQASNAEQRATDTPGAQFPPLPAALNDRLSYQDQTLPGGFLFRGSRQHHVFHGDLATKNIVDGTDTVRVAAIDGGLHTVTALNQFLALRPDLRTFLAQNADLRVELPNGVLQVNLPASAFSSKGDMASFHRVGKAALETGLKTIFPATWSDARIEAAVADVAQNGKPDRGTAQNGRVHMIGVHDGVRIVVVLILKQPVEIQDAYPAHSQNIGL